MKHAISPNEAATVLRVAAFCQRADASEQWCSARNEDEIKDASWRLMHLVSHIADLADEIQGTDRYASTGPANFDRLAAMREQARGGESIDLRGGGPRRPSPRMEWQLDDVTISVTTHDCDRNGRLSWRVTAIRGDTEVGHAIITHPADVGRRARRLAA